MAEGSVRRRPGRPKGPDKVRLVAHVLPATGRTIRFHAFTAGRSIGEYLDSVVEGRGLQGRADDPSDILTGVPPVPLQQQTKAQNERQHTAKANQTHPVPGSRPADRR